MVFIQHACHTKVTTVSQTSDAFWITAPCRGEIRDSRLGDGDLTVETRFSGVSRGTELLVFRALVPAESRDIMACPFQEGRFPYPVKYGYAAVGQVIDGPRRGETVFSLHPHQRRFRVPEAAALPVPTAVPAERAILAANMETALNGLWDAGAGPGDRVAVLGGGVVGQLVAYLSSRLPGAETVLVDPDADRRRIADGLGVRTSAAPPVDAPRPDIVVECTGAPQAVQQAIDWVGEEGVIVVISWLGQAPSDLMLGGRFHHGRLSLVSSQVGRLPPGRRGRWDHRRRLAKALTLLGDPVLDSLITSEGPLPGLPSVMAAMAAGQTASLCHLVTY